jgi:hypothetical protein
MKLAEWQSGPMPTGNIAASSNEKSGRKDLSKHPDIS